MQGFKRALRPDWPGANLPAMDLKGGLPARGVPVQGITPEDGLRRAGRHQGLAQAPHGAEAGQRRTVSSSPCGSAHIAVKPAGSGTVCSSPAGEYAPSAPACSMTSASPSSWKPHQATCARPIPGSQPGSGRMRAQRAGLQHDQRLALVLEAAPGDLRAARPGSRQGLQACARPARGLPHGRRLADGAAPKRPLKPVSGYTAQFTKPARLLAGHCPAVSRSAHQATKPAFTAPARVYVGHPTGPAPRAIVTVTAQAADLPCAGSASVPVLPA